MASTNTHSVLSFIWMGLVFFYFQAVFFAVLRAFVDNLRRPDLTGWAKAGWALVIPSFRCSAP